jgi:hypothetical protein
MHDLVWYWYSAKRMSGCNIQSSWAIRQNDLSQKQYFQENMSPLSGLTQWVINYVIGNINWSVHKTKKHTCIRVHIHECTPASTALFPLSFIHACIYIHIYTYIHKHTYIYIHTYIHMHIHKYLYTNVHTYTRTYVYPYTHTYLYTYCTHACMHAYIHTYIHTHTHTRTHTLYITLAIVCWSTLDMCHLWMLDLPPLSGKGNVTKSFLLGSLK